MNAFKNRLQRLILTSMSKKIVSATIICWMTYDLIDRGKFGTDWMGPAGAFTACLAYVGHIFGIDLKTKELFPSTQGPTNAPISYPDGGP